MIHGRQPLELPSGGSTTYLSLPVREKRGTSISHLPVSIRILLESVLQNVDGRRISDEDAEQVARWQLHAPRVAEPLT